LDDITAQPKSARAHHSGHRERLRERVRKGGLEALPDYELLELYLFRSIPLRDVKPLAKDLLARFGGLGGVLGASVEELKTVAGVGEAVAQELKLVHEAALRVSREPVRKRTVISSWSALLAYVKLALAHESREQFRVLFLDKKNQLIADEVMNRGTVDHAPVYPREVVRRALELSASSLILVHFVARHKMHVMCPTPLCGLGGRLRSSRQVIGLQRAHNRKQVRRAPPPRPDRSGGCRADVRASRYRNARRQVSPHKELSQSISAASSCHPGLRGGAVAVETGGSHSLRASAFIRRVISA